MIVSGSNFSWKLNTQNKRSGGGGLKEGVMSLICDILWHKFSYNILIEHTTMPIFLYSMLFI